MYCYWSMERVRRCNSLPHIPVVSDGHGVSVQTVCIVVYTPLLGGVHTDRLIIQHPVIPDSKYIYTQRNRQETSIHWSESITRKKS